MKQSSCSTWLTHTELHLLHIPEIVWRMHVGYDVVHVPTCGCSRHSKLTTSPHRGCITSHEQQHNLYIAPEKILVFSQSIEHSQVVDGKNEPENSGCKHFCIRNSKPWAEAVCVSTAGSVTSVRSVVLAECVRIRSSSAMSLRGADGAASASAEGLHRVQELRS